MSQKSFNLDDREYAIREAFDQLYPPPQYEPMPMPMLVEDNRPWLCDFFDDFVIVCDQGTNYKVPYTLNGEKVELAPRSEWKEAIASRVWTPVKMALLAVKAVGDWELDVTATPFGSRDSDGQWFDDRTDIMEEAFATPLVVYQHGIAQGAKALDEKPVVIGRAVAGTLKKLVDGWHVRVILDKANARAKAIMDAARKGAAAVSSGSISHLARLDIGGKMIQYEKDRPGRIAVWPLAEISIWEKGNGNVLPANQFAVALPAMKAMYREAGLRFPDLDTHGAPEALEVKRRAKVKQLQAKAKQTIQKLKTSGVIK
jgi:hypothetical protein